MKLSVGRMLFEGIAHLHMKPFPLVIQHPPKMSAYDTHD